MEQINEKNNDEALLSWETTAYPHYNRGAVWYILTGLAGGTLLVIAFWTNNFLLAALIIMVGVVMVLQGGTHPPTIKIEIGRTGIRRGAHFYAYTSIDHFWIVYD